MGGKKTLDDCKSGRDFNHYVVNDNRVREIRQSGSHVIVKGPLPGSAVFPNHPGDMPNGTRRSVIKMLIAIGLGVFMFVCLLGNLKTTTVEAQSVTAQDFVASVDGFICNLDSSYYACPED